MRDREPVSVLLPTREWSTVCEQLVAGLGPDDELLVICDAESDQVADHDPPAGVEVLVAGEPRRCSGKANALAVGMERATNDRFVWTDDDFERDSAWLDRLVAAGERYGPASAVPFFCGDGWWRPFEPWFGALFTLCFAFQLGGVADTAWGGGVTFTRDELTVDVPTFCAELRDVLSDDYLLTQRLPSVHAIRAMLTTVEVVGDPRAVSNRLVRFTRIVGVNEGWVGMTLLSCAVVVAVVAPLALALALTVGFAATYAALGIRRATFLLAFPGFLLLPIVTLVSFVRTDFEWAGRHYRFAHDGTVTVLDASREHAADD
ncbi:glycosyltransferase [Salinigranum halophilum]|uniref:glycosyltransferase n=1 Tax=Salinigranum halophilum TaxID=2565931 RepID=UPI0010A837BB|nr:glycosyltransferase [Salinigranum halophilum]